MRNNSDRFIRYEFFGNHRHAVDRDQLWRPTDDLCLAVKIDGKPLDLIFDQNGGGCKFSVCLHPSHDRPVTKNPFFINLFSSLDLLHVWHLPWLI